MNESSKNGKKQTKKTVEAQMDEEKSVMMKFFSYVFTNCSLTLKFD